MPLVIPTRVIPGNSVMRLRNSLTARIEISGFSYFESGNRSRKVCTCAGSKYENPEISIRAVKELRRRITELPGITRVGITSGIPLGRDNPIGYWLEGQPEPTNEVQWPVSLTYFVDEDLCKTLCIPLLPGRMLTERNTGDTPPVVLVDDDFVRIHFGGDVQAALRRRLRFKGEGEPWREIVGVVRHVTHYGLEEHARAEVYQPCLQMSPRPWVNDYLQTSDFS